MLNAQPSDWHPVFVEYSCSSSKMPSAAHECKLFNCKFYQNHIFLSLLLFRYLLKFYVYYMPIVGNLENTESNRKFICDFTLERGTFDI